MKIDRLLGIVIYLLNHDIVNAGALAEKFEVSPRTIQRDMTALNLAGIPVTSVHGSNGGYGIMDSFKLEKQITDKNDYINIVTALKGMRSAYDDKKLSETLEKLLSVSGGKQQADADVKLDFSVSREGRYIDDYLKIIQKAINEKHIIKFEYTDSMGKKTLQSAEPITTLYKWYAWYLFAYSRSKNDYRMFKIVRMRNPEISEKIFSDKYQDIDKLLAEHGEHDVRRYLNVKLLCKSSIRISAEEYFPNGNITELENGEFILDFTAPEGERGWMGILLTYGSKIKILEPKELKEAFIKKAEEIIKTYG